MAPAMSPLLTAGEILATRGVIDPVFLDSPSMRHLALDDALGCAATLKVETLNPIRSFKGRGPGKPRTDRRRPRSSRTGLIARSPPAPARSRRS
jgi:threonine dehydratase